MGGTERRLCLLDLDIDFNSALRRRSVVLRNFLTRLNPIVDLEIDFNSSRLYVCEIGNEYLIKYLIQSGTVFEQKDLNRAIVLGAFESVKLFGKIGLLYSEIDSMSLRIALVRGHDKVVKYVDLFMNEKNIPI